MVPALVDHLHRSAVVGGSWVLLHRLWISLPLSVGVVAWWLLFLVLVPAAYRSSAEPNQ